MPRRHLLALFFAASSLIGQKIPRPEFPQPQFQRQDWLTLNGQWQFGFDNDNAGLDAKWYEDTHGFDRKIVVPYCFESKLSGIGDTSFHPWVWYRRALEIPTDWKGRRVLLHFGAVDYRAMVWVNGQLAGVHEGGNTPFQLDITPLLKNESNFVTVRAEDPPTDRSIPRGKQYWEVKSKGIFYTRTTGIWQPVWLEATGSNYLTYVRTSTTNDGVARFEAEVARDQTGLEFAVKVLRSGQAVASGTGVASGITAKAAVIVNTPLLWSPALPQLYDVRFELRRNGELLDQVDSYFGFRSVGIENDRVTLNGRPVYLKLILDQGYWPQSILTPPTDEAIQYDIAVAKQMGFNGARKHQKVEDPRFLYWADKMGYLVSSEMANAQAFDNQAALRFTREWTESMARDYNHPSIIMWVPINESWGVPDLHDVRQQDYLKALYTLTHSLDATRLVIDNDGWEHTDMTDLFAIHDYSATGDKLYERYKNLGQTGVGVPNNARAALATGFRYNSSPIYLSEFGGIAFVPPGHYEAADAWGYAGVEKTAGDVIQRLKGLYSALEKLPQIAGFCYTQLTDVEQEINGLLTYDRKPKFDIKQIKQMNDSLH